jgi:thiol:disulfide interchange protein
LIGLVFIFGIALNLTPCVLPMMPINLAIIGAGAAGGSRAKGALRGGAYGLGIALSYGILALIPVLTGAAFGTLQATWWFNAAIAVVFILLALALLDVFMIDFTRFSSGGSGKQGTLAAFIAGAVSAVLAGACVAPILIAVLLLTTDYVAAGAYWALCLPFVLGLGMAAPWPIAGAGLSFLPRPGAWMMWVKKIFAVIVLIFAGYYGWTAIKTFLPHEGLDGADLPKIEAAIAEARAAGKPVLLDFWGPACKACDQMEASTLQDAAVVKELERFEVIKVRMDLADRAIRPTQERFKIQGLPTFIVID